MRLQAACVFMAISACVLAAEGDAGGEAEAGTVVLTERCNWRHHYERGLERISGDAIRAETNKLLSDALLKRMEGDTKRHLESKNIDWSKTDWRDVAVTHIFGNEPDDTGAMRVMVSWPPPSNWAAPDFDDSEWLRNRIKPLAQSRVHLAPSGMYNRAIYLRSAFEVPDPAKAKDLVLKLIYRGGIRVLVNGQEVARGHLPEGELKPDSKATDYPEDAYRCYIDECPDPHLGRRCVADLRFKWEDAPKGTGALQAFRNAWSGSWVNEKGWNRLMKLRDRELGPVTVPAKLLKKGRNVVAVEIRCSHFHPIVIPGAGGERFTSGNWVAGMDLVGWEHARLIKLDLRDPAGALPDMSMRPETPRVIVEDMHQRVYQRDYIQTSEPVGILRFVGAQNGTFNGQVLVSASGGEGEALGALKASATELKNEGGAVIPAANVAVQYMVAEPLKELIKCGNGRGDERDPLNPVAMDAVYYSSTNPDVFKAAPGRVVGTELEKAKYFDHISPTAPESVPEKCCQPVWVSLRVPPDAAPGVYKGTLKIEATGMESVSVPIEAEVVGWRIPSPQEFQTDSWLEQSPYAVARRYKVPLWSERHFKLLETSFKLMARSGNDTLFVPVLTRTEFGNIEDPGMIKWILKKDKSITFDYTAMDRYFDLAVKHMGKPRVISFVIMHYMMASASPQVLVFNEETNKNELLGVGWKEDAFKRIPIWKNFAIALYDHMKTKGLEKSIRWGHAGDVESDPALIALMVDLFPETYWTASPHSRNGGSGGGGHNWGIFRIMTEIYSKAFQAESSRGWKKEDETYMNPFCIRNFGGGISPPFLFRVIPEQAIHMGFTGVGHLGFDYYDFTWQSGYQGADWNPPGIPCFTLVYPGPEGTESSARYEAYLEGIQETEARIYVEQCLDRNILPMELAKEVQAIVYNNSWTTVLPKFGSSKLAYFTNGWQERERKIFQAAAKVAKVVSVDVEKTAFKTSVPALGKNALSIKLRNWTAQPRAWKAATSDKWIVPSRMEGSLNGMEELVVTLDGAGQEPGKELAGALTITDAASGMAFSVKITANVTPPLEFLFDHPHFNVGIGETETRDFRVVNRAATEQSWALAASVPWLKIEPVTGKLAPGATIFVNITATPPDKEAITHVNTLTFTAAGNMVKLPVASKTFVIPKFVAPEALPLGRKVELEKVDAKQVKSHGCCIRGTIANVGWAFRGKWGSSVGGKPTHSATTQMGGTHVIPLVGTQKFERAMWVTPHHETVYDLSGTEFREFSAFVGIPKDVSKAHIRDFNRRVNFELHVDGKIHNQTGLMTAFDEPRLLVGKGLENAKEIKLVTRLDSDGDNGMFMSIWADANFWKKE